MGTFQLNAESDSGNTGKQLKVVAMKRRGQRESGYAKWKSCFQNPALKHLSLDLLHSVDNQLTTNHVFSLGYFRHGCYGNNFLCFVSLIQP